MRLRDSVIVAGVSALVAILGPSTASAGVGWTNAGVITDITQQAAGDNAFVNFSANVTGNTAGCSTTTGFYFWVTDDRTKRMFSMLLAAQAAGRQVKVFFTGACHPWGIALVDAVMVIS
jgi:hypothetical protein